MNAKYFTNFVFCSLIAATANLASTEECNIFYDDRVIKREIAEVKNRLSAVEGQLSAHKVQLAAIESENASLKNQLDAVQEGPANYEEHRQRLDATEDLSRALAKYANNEDGLLPLLYAAKIGDVETVRLLIENGADIHTRCIHFFYINNDQGSVNHIPLTIAAHYNQYEVAELLLSLGADVKRTAERNSRSALAYAAEFGSGKLVKLFIDNGADLNIAHPNFKPEPTYSSFSKAPLCFAGQAGNYEAIVALIEGGADINGGCKIPFPYETPLDKAAKYLKYSNKPQNLELVKLLVEKGAMRRDRNCPCPVISAYLQSVGR